MLDHKYSKTRLTGKVGLFFAITGFSQMATLAYAPLAKGAIPQSSAPLQIKDWFALGSGCKGKEGGIGDVRLKVQQDPKNPLSYQVEFSMPTYQLQGDKPVSDKPSFARECSFRLAAYPDSEHKIASVQAHTTLMLNKDKGATTKLKSRLLTGSGSLAFWDQEFSAQEQIKNKILAIDLSPNQEGQQHMQGVPCAEPKILGVDLQLLNLRDSFKPAIEIKPTEPQKLTMQITLARCNQATKIH